MSTKLKPQKEPLLQRFWKWLKSHKFKIGGVGAVIAMYSAYVNTGADSLRTEIYQPLYQEINTMDDAIHANILEKNYSTQSYDAIRKNGNLLRVPKRLRNKISRLYQLASEEHSHVLPLEKIIAYKMPQEITKIRTEADDKAWAEKTTAQLNAQLRTPVEVYGFSFTMSHTARSAEIITDPQHPRIGSPGLITWELNDWMRFPQSASDLSWPNTWFLSFDERNDSWYYRITQDDLTRLHMSIEEFLRPIHQTLSSEPEFQQLLQKSKESLSLMTEVKAEIADRVNHPKQLMDLSDF